MCKSSSTSFMHFDSKTQGQSNSFKMDQVMAFVEPGRQFAKDSIRLVKRCTKPDRKEFQKIAMATAIGFCIMGFIGFFVKLIHIPINNIIVGS
ncbi:Protein transport protein Sec61 subunit gamma [Orchesella cincta]|uniref:Protein transport protein Sec61 subunit gamma n=1 Tax=Orchesella cincta TaxID=48709 RepID=A0A1D2MIC7_ORCCI|nr:Protein transport protein Sec61 subunit gamma [Orchesella cincta]